MMDREGQNTESLPEMPEYAIRLLNDSGSIACGKPVALPIFDDSISDKELDAMLDNATAATNFLKAIGHEGRLMILCHLATGEKSVTELEDLLSARQAAVSQQLGRLRLEGLVKPRRDGKTIYYSLTDDRCRRMMALVYDMFCK